MLSCSYDKTIIAWKYETKTVVERIERSEELRCMDYISATRTLFVGTNQKNILTVSIEKLLDPYINLISFTGREGEEFNLVAELEA